MSQKYCLSCGKPLQGGEDIWHIHCARKVFGVSAAPRLLIRDEDLLELAKDKISQSVSVTGVQKKISLGLSKAKGRPFTFIDCPSGFILKPQMKEKGADFPEAENLVMSLADLVGIPTVPHGLLPLNGGELAYITKRVDREGDKKIAMEDFCQLSQRLTEDKYHSSYEQCKKIIVKYSDQKVADLRRFVYLILFSYLVGNSDMHLKNFSLIEHDGTYCLSPAYDLMPVNIVYPNDTDEFALTLHGKRKNVTKNDILAFANSGRETERVEASIVKRMMKKLCSLVPNMLEMVDASPMSPANKEKMKNLILKRAETFR